VLTVAGPAAADLGAGDFEGLANRVFAVEAWVVYSVDPTLPEGTVFENCYSFNADGTWFDPLYPDLGSAVPGVWVQYAESPKILYSATVSESAVSGGPYAGLLLTQNGIVNTTEDNGRQKLLAYTTVYFEGFPIIDVVANGRSVASCPYF
jgi:hypothetical protein